MRAKGVLAPGLGKIDSAPRLQPLPVVVDERHRARRHAEHALRDPYDIVEHGLGCGIEDRIAFQGVEPRRLIVRDRKASIDEHDELSKPLSRYGVSWLARKILSGLLQYEAGISLTRNSRILAS